MSEELKPVRAKDFYSLFVALGGGSAVARAVGLNKSTVSEMSRRGTLPAWRWPQLRKLARDKGFDLTYEHMVKMTVRAKEAKDHGENNAGQAN